MKIFFDVIVHLIAMNPWAVGSFCLGAIAIILIETITQK